MDLESWSLLIFAFAVFSAFVHGTIGFGFPLVSTALFSIILPMQQAILITLFPTVLINLSNILYGKNSLALIREYGAFAIFIFVGTAIGSYLLVIGDSAIFEFLLGITIFIYLYLRFQKKPWFYVGQFSNKWIYIPVFGFVGGIVGGAVNVMLVVSIIYASGITKDKDKQIQILNFTFLCGKISQIIFFSERYLSGLNYLKVSLIATAICFPGLIIGFLLRNKINQNLYQKILFLFLFAMGCYLIFQSSDYFLKKFGWE